MKRLRIAREVGDAFPDLDIVVIVVTGFAGEAEWPEVANRLSAAEQNAAAGLDPDGAAADFTDEQPHIAAWHAAYRDFGTNPRRQRPSVDALRRRLGKSGRLPRISPAVDCYNLISVSHVVPAGAFDLARVAGDIDLRFADGAERFTPLGEPDTTETPRAGEVIYTDAAGVLTRHWNHRDADRTKVTERSQDLVFLLETVRGKQFGPLLDQASEDLTALLRTRASAVAVRRLSAAEPQARLAAEPASSGEPADRA